MFTYTFLIVLICSTTFDFGSPGLARAQPHHILLLAPSPEEGDGRHPHLLLPRATARAPGAARDQEHDGAEVTRSRTMAAAAPSLGDERDDDGGGKNKWSEKGERGGGDVLARGQI